MSRHAPIPAGTLCRLGSLTVRAYAQIWPGRTWDGTYRCYLDGVRKSYGIATRDQLDVIAQTGGAM